ncbi:MAG: Flp family type IVb pilin [Alphaproteobacteria bacterium]|nr:Flp family type IVb pilin [Alphaproteobacteria bacterium]
MLAAWFACELPLPGKMTKGAEMLALLHRFGADESGVTAIEYALIASMMVIAVVTGSRVFTESVNSIFNFVANQVAAASTP